VEGGSMETLSLSTMEMKNNNNNNSDTTVDFRISK
jgi:hypothetical protein